MLYAYQNKDSKDVHLACTSCVETNIVQDVDFPTAEILTTHPKQGQLVNCDYCGKPNVLIVPQRPRVTDRKVILSLSIPESLKNRILAKVKQSGKNINALCYPLLVPILENEFPNVENDETDSVEP